MAPKDPVEHVEDLVREMHDSAKAEARPVLRKYPLLFTFLITFSVAAVFHSFELLSDQYALFHEHPLVLLGIGVLGLFVTGTLYKKLSK